MSGNVAPKISTNGLVLYLDAGNTKSYSGTGTTWVDISQSGNNGTLINSPTFNSSNGGGIVFDGVDDYVTQSNITSNSLTFDFWFRVTDKTSGYHYVMSYGNNVAGQMVSISIANTAVGTYGISVREIYCFLGGSDPSLRGTDFIINFNTTYNVVMTVTNGSSTIGFYVNGINYPITNATTLNLGTTFGLGRWVSQNSNFLKGTIFSGKVYNRILTQTEITQNYNATKGRFGL